MKKLLFICVCAALILTSAGCGSREKSGGYEIYIPILADAAWLTSDGAFINGASMAVEDVNTEYSEKGFTTKIAIIDDMALYETGVEIAAKAAEDPKVTAVLNLQNFDVSKATAGILTESGKPVIFPYGAYDNLFEKENPYMFCGVAAFSNLGKAMAGDAIKKGYKRIAIYHNGGQSQEELVTAFELALLNTDTKVVDYVPSIASESDFDSIYMRWKALDVDCVVISQYGLERAFEVLKMIRARDKDIAVMGEPIFNRANALDENKAIAEGMTVPSTLDIEDSAQLRMFQERYQEKYGKDADIWAVQGYDMLRLVVDTAVKLNTNEPSKIAEALHDKKGYQGIGRKIAFASGGAMVADVNKLRILVCKNGSFQ